MLLSLFGKGAIGGWERRERKEEKETLFLFLSSHQNVVQEKQARTQGKAIKSERKEGGSKKGRKEKLSLQVSRLDRERTPFSVL
mmetsp:Transcript_25486/g.49837  ORF Transcript_25486/g.49837 Transcript_25486/m.49837 type:complete len:84 (+) Transcript_25486:785-1036(+)